MDLDAAAAESRYSSDDGWDSDSSYDSSAGCPIEALPDELLVNILSRIEDGTDLLENVALVCKRWHRVSRDPYVWANVRLVVPWEDFDDEALNVLALAPALRSLRLAWRCSPDKDGDTLWCLRRCRAAVRELHIGTGVEDYEDKEPSWYEETLDADAVESPFYCPRQRELPTVLDLMARNQDHLRVLTMGLEVQHRPSSQRRGRPNRRGDVDVLHSVFEALGQLQLLEELHLELMSDRDVSYAGELSAGLPNLRCLTVRLSDVQTAIKFQEHDLQDLHFGPGVEAMLGDLLRGAASSLRHLALVSSKLSPAVAECVERCAGLRSLTISPAYISTVRSLPQLQTLELFLLDCFDADVKTVCEWVSFVRHSNALLASLLHLRLHIDWHVEDRPGCRDLLLAVVEAAPTLASLRLLTVYESACVREAVYEPLLSALPSSLRSLHVGQDFPAQLVPRLADLSGLQRLAGMVKGEEGACAAAFADLKEKRPDVCIAELKSVSQVARLKREAEEARQARERSPKWYAWWDHW